MPRIAHFGLKSPSQFIAFHDFSFSSPFALLCTPSDPLMLILNTSNRIALKMSVMNLTHFPLEVLELILDFGISFEVLQLWKSGYRLLASKLATGVKCIILENTSWNDTSRWPLCLPGFERLEELSISSSSEALGSHLALRRELQHLSSNLRVLKLDVLFLERVMYHFKDPISPTSEDDSPRPSKRSKQVDTADADTLHAEIWNLDITLPRLEELSLVGSLAILAFLLDSSRYAWSSSSKLTL